MDSIVLTIWTALHLPSHIKFRHSKSVAIENLLFEKLLVFSPLLSSSKYVGGVMATARLFIASVSKQCRVHTSLPWPMLVRDLARGLVWRSGAYSPQRPMAAGMRPVAWSPHRPPPAPMLKSRFSPSSDARHWSPDVILGFVEYALFFPIYICLSFSLFAP